MLNPCFFKLNCEDYTRNFITKGFATAFFFSAFIYFEYLEINATLINTIFVTISYGLLITIHKKAMFYAGFFIGLIWFWWVGNSFIYYDLSYLIPVVILFFSLSYGLFFYLTAAIFNNIFIRAILVYSLSFFEPFGFNWLKMDLPLINTYYNTYESKINRKSLNIYMPQYNINQTDKWNKNNFESIISKYIQDIDYAIKNKYDLIILPETAIPSVLNTHQELLTLLKEKSQNISIVTGALSLENNQYLNSTYMFEKGSIQIANKVVLVPFGESIPLPNFLRDFINDVFFDGASDYQSAREATTFNIMNVKYRNAICWEATTDTIYENLDTKNIIVTSNNAWFVPSIEPVLQNLLLKYYAKKYDLTIYHSSNKSPNSIIRGDSIKKYN